MVILLKIRHPHIPAGSVWMTMDGIVLYSGISDFLFKSGWCQSQLQWGKSEFTKRDKSCQITVLSKTVHHVQQQWLKKNKTTTLFFIKIPLPSYSIIHMQYPACKVTKYLMWYRNTFTHFRHNMHLKLDPSNAELAINHPQCIHLCTVAHTL